MKSLRTSSYVLLSAGVLYLVGQYFQGDWPQHFPVLCLYKESAQGAYCNWPYLDIGLSFIAAGEIFFIVGIILLFANEVGLRRWWRVSRWYVPIATAFIAIAGPLNFSPLGLLNGGSGDYATGVWILGLIYIIITLVVVIKGRLAAGRLRS